MAFPTTSVLDNFNRADGNPGANWTSPVWTDGGIFQIASNQAAFSFPALGGYWNPATFGPDCEIYATFPVLSGDDRLFIRIASPGATANGYMLWVRNTSQLFFYRLDAGVATQLGSLISGTFANFDQLGISATGSAFVVYQNGASIGTFSDATYGAAGYIGWWGNTFGDRGDDFGGGTIGGAVIAQPSLLLPRSVTPQLGR